MPEGPEASQMSDVLNRDLAGKIFYDFDVINFDITNLTYFKAQLPMQILQVFARGKKVIFELCNVNGYFYIITSLGMTGRWVYVQMPKTRAILTVATFDNDIMNFNRYVYFDDERKFGDIEICFNQAELLATLATHLGPDLMRDNISNELWIQTWRKSKYQNWILTKALMDQRVFCSIGNYLKSEILYRSRLAPRRTIGSLSNDELIRLLQVAKATILESYHEGGFTIERFLRPDGERGRFQAQVYKRKLDPFGNQIIAEKIESKSAQTTYWVQGLQV